jgi:hypothetical protein
MGNAQLVAIGFAVAFSATGIGAPVGFLIGSMVGNMLFPPKPLQSEGPRLGDLQVSSSSYGAPRALGYGTVRQGGNVIWSIPIQEKKKTSTISGGKGSMGGSPDTKQTTYSYYGTWAQAFGEGPANDVLRMWSDGKLLFDKRSVATATHKKGLNFRFYTGGETQLVDPAIEADKGVGNAPAFRGTCYIVFEDVPLADYGNRIPNITAEIAYNATDARTSQVSTDLASTATTQWSGDMFAVDWERGFFYAVDGIGGTGATTFLRKFRLSDLQEVQQISGTDCTTDDSSFVASSFIHVLPSGDLVVPVKDDPSSTNTLPIILVDGNSLREKARFGTGGAAVAMNKSGFMKPTRGATLSLYTPLSGRRDFIVLGTSNTNHGNLGILQVNSDSLGFTWGDDNFGVALTSSQVVHALCPGKVGESEGTAYAVQTQLTTPTTTNIEINQIKGDASLAYNLEGAVDTVMGFSFNNIATFTYTDLFPGATTWANGSPAIWYDETDDNVILYALGTVSAVDEARFFKIDTTDGSVIWTSEILGAGVRPGNSSNGSGARVRGNTLGGIRLNNGWLLDTTTGEFLINDTAPDWLDHDQGSGAYGYYDSITETFTGPAASGESTPIVRYFMRRKTDTGVSVGTIVKDLADRTGLDSATDLDTTSIDATLTDGFLIGRQSNARAAMTPLSQLYFFDGFESDDKLNFVLRGGSSVRTITQADFATLDKNGQVIKESRTQEVELPERFSLLYLDKENDYLQNAHHAKRIAGPTPAMKSDNKLGLDYPGAMDATEAKQIAEKSLYTSWVERSQFQIRVPWTHLDLDPSDVITITLDNGQSLRARIAQADVGVDFSIELVAIGEETQQFLSIVPGSAGSGVPVQTIQASVYVTGILMDVPLLRDGDEIASRASNPIYAAMGAAQEGQFVAGTLYKSPDGGGSFEETRSFVSEMAWGTTTNALAAPVSVWATDTVNTLNVQMTSGGSSLVSITAAQMLAGGNHAALFKANGEIEVIQFQNVTAEADGTYTLDTLLRGRRGTDTMHTGHAVGEKFLFLDPLDVEMFTLELADRNSAIVYRSVGSGQLFDDGENQTLTSVHRALMPYHPAQHAIADGASSSTDISWVRRTRVGGALQDSFGVVPLSEDTEEYELEIYSGPAGTLKRTITGLTSPTYNYSSTDQGLDGFTAPVQTLTFKVFQISAQVGRGFSEEVTVSV